MTSVPSDHLQSFLLHERVSSVPPPCPLVAGGYTFLPGCVQHLPGVRADMTRRSLHFRLAQSSRDSLQSHPSSSAAPLAVLTVLRSTNQFGMFVAWSHPYEPRADSASRIEPPSVKSGRIGGCLSPLSLPPAHSLLSRPLLLPSLPSEPHSLETGEHLLFLHLSPLSLSPSSLSNLSPPPLLSLSLPLSLLLSLPLLLYSLIVSLFSPKVPSHSADIFSLSSSSTFLSSVHFLPSSHLSSSLHILFAVGSPTLPSLSTLSLALRLFLFLLPSSSLLSLSSPPSSPLPPTSHSLTHLHPLFTSVSSSPLFSLSVRLLLAPHTSSILRPSSRPSPLSSLARRSTTVISHLTCPHFFLLPSILFFVSPLLSLASPHPSKCRFEFSASVSLLSRGAGVRWPRVASGGGAMHAQVSGGLPRAPGGPAQRASGCIESSRKSGCDNEVPRLQPQERREAPRVARLNALGCNVAKRWRCATAGQSAGIIADRACRAAHTDKEAVVALISSLGNVCAKGPRRCGARAWLSADTASAGLLLPPPVPPSLYFFLFFRSGYSFCFFSLASIAYSYSSRFFFSNSRLSFLIYN
ncbi:hypothetical protein C7M84_004547 [Penaeus vannamei]|uniref:Uncharacterized protein n=1 Tax=Penaeus vannamei TaxID=6689 RepID=A0A423TK90_PENVA|nr:hypothetical protein C7M84_004547 [Penaeus vannamei]